MHKPLVSVIIPTCERGEYLKECIDSLKEEAFFIQAIVVDASGEKEDKEWIKNKEWVKVIYDERKGPVKAFNKGFYAAEGKYVMWLNDDARIIKEAIKKMHAFLEENKNVKIGAFYFSEGALPYGVRSIYGVPFANFGMMEKAFIEEMHYFDESFFYAGADPDICLRTWERGFLVGGCKDAKIFHHLAEDHIREENEERINKDWAFFWKRWKERIKKIIKKTDEKIVEKYFSNREKGEFFFAKHILLLKEGKRTKELLRNASFFCNQLSSLERANVFYNCGSLCEREGLYKMGAEKFYKVLSLIKDKEDPFQRRLYAGANFHLGSIFYHLDEKKKAREHLLNSLSILPHHQEAKSLLKKIES